MDFKTTPQWPWNGMVDITYRLECDDVGARIAVSFSGKDAAANQSLTLKTLSGDGVLSELPAGGPYKTTWNFGADYPGREFKEAQVTMTAKVVGFYAYMVMNLVDGTKRYSATGPDLSDDTCRTTELWLRTPNMRISIPIWNSIPLTNRGRIMFVWSRTISNPMMDIGFSRVWTA